MARSIRLPKPIELRYSTIDHFVERKIYWSMEGAQAYARKRMGTDFEISNTFGYAVSSDGVGKLEILDGVTFQQLLGRSE